MKLKFIAVVSTLSLGLMACDKSTSKGVVGVAYQALQHGNYSVFAATFTPNAREIIATPSLFETYQEYARTFTAFKMGAQQVFQNEGGIERARTVVLGRPTAATPLAVTYPEGGVSLSAAGDYPVGNPPAIYPGADAHLYPDVINAGDYGVPFVEAFTVETECDSFGNKRTECFITDLIFPTPAE